MDTQNIVIIGGCGNIGTKLKVVWPSALSVDRAEGADLVFDLDNLGFDDADFITILEGADVVIHLASCADPNAPEAVHFQSLENSAKLVHACSKIRVPKLILASSDWAEPKDSQLKINAYGYSKLALESMAQMYTLQKNCVAIALRIGWVPVDDFDLSKAPEWLLENHWDNKKLASEFKKVVDIDSQ